MAVTKEIVAYTSYKENGYEARVYSDKRIEIINPNGSIWYLKDLPSKWKEEIKTLIDFVEKDLNHSFTPATDEFED